MNDNLEHLAPDRAGLASVMLTCGRKPLRPMLPAMFSGDVERRISRLLEAASSQSPEDAAKFFHDDGRVALRASEIVCLLVGRAYEDRGAAFGYAEVMDFSYSNMPKPFAEGTTHKCFAALLELRFIAPERKPHLSRAGRPRQLYSLTNSGRVALYLAIATAKHLAESRSQALQYG